MRCAKHKTSFPCAKCKRNAYQREYRANQSPEYRAARQDYQERYKTDHPEYVERTQTRQKWRWATEPEYRARMTAYRYAKYTPEQLARAEKKHRLAIDKEYWRLHQQHKKERKNAARRLRYKTDAEFRERQKARDRYRHSKRSRDRENAHRRELRAAKTAALTALREIGVVRGYEFVPPPEENI